MFTELSHGDERSISCSEAVLILLFIAENLVIEHGEDGLVRASLVAPADFIDRLYGWAGQQLVPAGACS